MIISVAKEVKAQERRIALSLETAQKYLAMGFELQVEKGAGELSGIKDEDFAKIGVKIVENAYQGTDVLLKIWAPIEEEFSRIEANTTILAHFDYAFDTDKMSQLQAKNTTCFALNLMPRISRAQSMDILSSQSNLAGYKAVIDAVAELDKAVPLMMTAAGTVAPVRFLILGAGVAGLQAVATAKRLGGIVFASDVRPQVKEQVESLGGRFVDVKTDENLETSGGYAKETSEAYQRKQNEAVKEQLKTTDVLITTALIPNKKAPLLVTKEMLKLMPEGSVAIDLAAESGGNIEGTKNGGTVEISGVKVIGDSQLASKLSASASKLYARNLFNFLSPMYDKATKKFQFNFDDEIVQKTCLFKTGEKND
ncbi:MAG: NAD(P) transhydrogenase subunit alpha [Alphaproteobacteria bacterium]|nr:NAD(P) transhydrogenase subunit alpha [Alphaproteobacteria bacterium]